MKSVKRIAVLILSLVMLISLLPLGATVSAATIEKEAFYMVNISSNPDEIPYIYHMPEFYAPPINNPDEWTGISAYDSTYIEDIAAEMKDDFDSRPAGTRYIQFNMLRVAAQCLNENVVYLDEAVEFTKDWLTEFLKEYKRIGGKIDGIIVDVEYEHIESYNLYKWVYNGEERAGVPANQNIYKDIVADPRYATQIRPLLEERGFQFWPNPTGDQSEIWGMNYQVAMSDPVYTQNYYIWDAVAQYIIADAVNESILAPLLKYYPNAVVSDYQTPDFKSWLKPFYDGGGIRAWNAPKAGNASNFNTYNNRVHDGIFGSASDPKYSSILGYNKAIFGSEPFTMTMWDVNMFKKMFEATDTGLVNAWIAGYNSKWGNANTCTTSNTPYYTETLFHMGLMDMAPSFIGYIVTGEEGDNYSVSLQVVSDILKELTRVAGASDRKIIPTPVSWNGGYVLSGMYAGGRNIWRITPNTELVSLEDFKVKDKAPTFSCDGQTIVFPQGRIIEDGYVSVVGSCGYWVETPANVMPVITSTTDRYAKYPAFEENFEQYDLGTTLSADTALPKKVWETSGISLKVQSDGNGKVLALTGTASLKNVKLPQNVTAGDSYAKQQAWEVTFRLPADLSADGVLKLLSCGDNDGGIKVSGGKTYYDEAGTYKELADVNLPAGKYTVRREVDFRTEGAFTSAYTIYNEAGMLLKEVKDIPMNPVKLPVTAIEIACENVNSKILIDNYKLYPIGVTTDMSVYDAETGKQLELNGVRTKDTAYRLAWMNATNENRVAYVYNAKNGLVIQKVEMPAGQDGVITGVVEASAGTAVQLAIKVDKGTDTVLPNYDNGDFGWPTMVENFGKPDNSGNGNSTEPTESQTVPETTPGTEPVTEPSTEPTTEPTTPSTTQPTTLPEVTQPSDTLPQVTQPSDPTDSDAKKGLTGGQIALIVVIVALLAGGGFVTVWFVLKNKKAAAGEEAAETVAVTEETKAPEATEETEGSETAEVSEVTEEPKATETPEVTEKTEATETEE